MADISHLAEETDHSLTATITVLAMLVAQLNRRHPGLAKDVDADFERFLHHRTPTEVREGRPDPNKILAKVKDMILDPALNDPASRKS